MGGQIRFASALFLAASVAVSSADEGSGVTKKSGPPPFFLQDAQDSMCMGGEEYKRCSIDTLFFVSGSPGTYQIHKRPHDDDVADEDGICLGMKSCTDKDAGKVTDAKVVRCSHQCAKQWNILGDADTGYVLTHGEGDSKLCLVRTRPNNKAVMAPCDSQDHPYTALTLQFASSQDIKTMASPAARFIGAAADGDVKTLKAMIKKDKIDVNEKDWDELTAIIPAASGGHLDTVKFLIKEGADVNAKDKDGITALMEASIMGHVKIVEALLGAGAEVDAKANSEVTALWLAAGEGRTDVVKLLLNKGADASNTRVDGITALMTSSVSGHVAVVEQLLKAGADPKTTDGDGLTCLHNGAENGTVPVLKALLAGLQDDADAKSHYIDLTSTTGFSPLIIAAAHGHSDAVRYLIKEGADPNAVHDNGVTALMYAAASGHVDVMKVLLEEGKADVNQLHTNDGHALLEASTGNSSEAIIFLLENGAQDDLLDEDGVTPLMAAASQGALKGMNALLDSLKKHMSTEELREHINMASFSGGTSVMFAAAGGHAECTRILIELGANVNDIAQATPEYLEKLAKMIEEGTVTQDDPHVDGVTALHVAAQGGHLECANILIEAGAEVGIEDDEDRTPLLLAVKGNYGEIATVLVKAGADPNTPYVDEDGESHNLLMDAIIVENEDFAQLLIESGADLYHEDEHKVTTLLQASHRGMKDIVKLLLEKHLAGGTHEGWINSSSDEGITPLIAAASEGHKEVVENLIVTGKADVDASDKDGTNSIMASAARGHVEIVDVLLKAGAKVNEQNADGHTALMFAYNGKNQVETLWERYKQFMAEPKEGEAEEDKEDGGTGVIIKDALLNHTKMVESLINSGADQKIKDKEGHVAKDFDFHPDADAEVLNQEKEAEKKRDASKNEL
eukprot:CAMPEP_0178518028 /NCGR_PEP_ID=MMETSP0696-20121128/26021_1 /TAXON_ID=265572 /ORGANISM="Extubocellulus spinifer, Strain CCMP396" /LENGTH=908 /DNA_ID=CAMNT_0020148529 /DNA_START=66 /DNA_END=2792 /DNA_ORIENTATION=-